MASRAASHRFDPVSFVLGVMAVTAGLTVLGGGSLLDDATVLFPAGLIALGVAILLRVGARREAPLLPLTVPLPPTAVAGQTLSGAELYDLLVPDPTEEFLAEVEERERSTRPPGGENPVVDTDPVREPEAGSATAADPTEPAAAAPEPAATEPAVDPPEVAATEPAADPTEPAATEPAVDPTEPAATEPAVHSIEPAAAAERAAEPPDWSPSPDGPDRDAGS